jgi:hypothetical protein
VLEVLVYLHLLQELLHIMLVGVAELMVGLEEMVVEVLGDSL